MRINLARSKRLAKALAAARISRFAWLCGKTFVDFCGFWRIFLLKAKYSWQNIP